MNKTQLLKTITTGMFLILGFVSLRAQTQNALDFDGLDDNVQITHFNRPDTLTLEAWVKNTTEPGERDIISWSNSAGGFTSEFLQEGDSVYYAEWNGTLWATSFRADISDGNWHHIAIVRNGNGPNNVSMYRDGVLLGTNTINNSGPTDDLRIGAENYFIVQRFYSGTLDELRIWDYAKTQAEIQNNMVYELSGTESGLILIYNFNQGIANGNNPSVTTLLDSGPNSNNGTLNDFALNGTTSNWVGGAPICIPSFGTDARTECDSLLWLDGITYYTNNNSATFNIVGGAANGCDSLVTLDLTINSVSDITTSISGVTIFANNTGATYQWLDCLNNNSVITSETGQSFTATANGNYAVELTENGCVDTSACVSVTTVGIIENSFGNGLMVYPNPTSGNFSVDLGSVYESSEVSIMDINGKLIYSKIINKSQILNLSIEEPVGVYLISIKSADKQAVIRIVKE